MLLLLHVLQAKLLSTDQGTCYVYTGGARDPSTSAVPHWLSDWRLKLALGSWQLYQELWMELSGAAAACYTRCGRKRNGALMMPDIADALMARGNVARAAVVLQRQCRLFLKEGWWELAAAVLPRLLQCQKMLMQVLLLVKCFVCKLHLDCITTVTASSSRLYCFFSSWAHVLYSKRIITWASWRCHILCTRC